MKTFLLMLLGLTSICFADTPGIAQPSAQQEDQTVKEAFKSPEVTRKAQLLTKPEPTFTKEARESGTEGVVRLRMILRSDGTVSNIMVVKGLPHGLTEKAIEAAKQIRFIAAQKDGRRVSQWVTIEYNFNTYYDEDDEVERPAVILEKPEAEYTDEARRNKVTGKVVLRVILYKTGEATVDSVVKGLPLGLTEKAVEAARKIKFTPAEDKGRPVNQIRTIEYEFTL